MLNWYFYCNGLLLMKLPSNLERSHEKRAKRKSERILEIFNTFFCYLMVYQKALEPIINFRTNHSVRSSLHWKQNIQLNRNTRANKTVGYFGMIPSALDSKTQKTKMDKGKFNIAMESCIIFLLNSQKLKSLSKNIWNRNVLKKYIGKGNSFFFNVPRSKDLAQQTFFIVQCQVLNRNLFFFTRVAFN